MIHESNSSAAAKEQDSFLPGGVTGREVLALFLLIILVLVSRVSFWTGLPYAWDSVQLALGAMNYDPVHHRPHMPGYYLFTRAAAWLMPAEPQRIDAMRALERLNLVLTLAAAAGTYLLTRLLAPEAEGGRRAAMLASVLLIVSPVFWLYSIGTESYTADAALGVWVCVGLWWMRSARMSTWIVGAALAGCLLAVWAGVRSTGALLFFPLTFAVLVSSWRLPHGPVRIIALFLAFFLTLQAWFLPWLREFPGGLAQMRALSEELFRPILAQHSILYGAPLEAQITQAIRAAYWYFASLGEAGFTVAALLAFMAFATRRSEHSSRFPFLLSYSCLLFLPAFLLHAFFFAGKPAYWFVVLPQAFVVLALAWERNIHVAWKSHVILAVVLVAAVRFIAPALGGVPLPRTLERYSAGEILTRQQGTLDFIERAHTVIDEHTAEGRTTLFAFTQESPHLRWRHLHWMIPDALTVYRHRYLSPDGAPVYRLQIAQHDWERWMPGDFDTYFAELAQYGRPYTILIWPGEEQRAQLLDTGSWRESADPALGNPLIGEL